MVIKVYRHSGLPPDPVKFKAFTDDFAIGYDGIVKEHGEFNQENSEAFQKSMFTLEQEIFEKYPRMESVDVLGMDHLGELINLYGSLCFVKEINQETMEQELIAYVMDGPLPQ